MNQEKARREPGFRLHLDFAGLGGVPTGIRTPVATVKG